MNKDFFRQAIVLSLTAIAVGSLLLLLFSRQATVSAAPSPLLASTESDSLAALRAAGLHGDRTQLPLMVQALKNGHPAYISTALHALSHLGAVETLSTMDETTTRPQPDYVLKRMKVAHARLMAEAEAQNSSQPVGKAQTEVERFLKELNVDGTRVNGIVSDYRGKHDGEYDTPLEVYALQELADMAYRNDAVDYKQLPQLHNVDFSLDPGASLKMQIVLMPKKARVGWMIDTLARKNIRSGTEAMLTQLAVDEGLPASHAAAIKLKEMQSHPADYSEVGFGLLFDVIRGVGDKDQASVVEGFVNDPSNNGGISHYARIDYPFIKQGLRCQYAVGY